MNPTNNPFKNRTFTAPAQDPSLEVKKEMVQPLEVFTDGESFTLSAWQPSPEEVAALNAGGKVWLYVYAGGVQPPVGLVAATDADIIKAHEITPTTLDGSLALCPVCNQLGVPIPPDYHFDEYQRRYQAHACCTYCTEGVVIVVLSGNRIRVQKDE